MILVSVLNNTNRPAKSVKHDMIKLETINVYRSKTFLVSRDLDKVPLRDDKFVHVLQTLARQFNTSKIFKLHKTCTYTLATHELYNSVKQVH